MAENMESTAPSSSTVSRTALLILRILTFVFLLIALILIAVNKQTETVDGDETKVKFNDLISYRYMMATIVIGFVYSLIQTVLSILNVVSVNRLIGGDFGYLLDFFGDKIISYLLATGAAAGYGATQDVRRNVDYFDDFFDKANASASLLLVAFLFTAIASVFTSYALPKKV